MATIIVTDGEQRAALAVVRSLGRAGHRVIVTADRRPCLAGSSRFAAASVTTTNPLDAPTRFANEVAELERKWEADVIIPITDHALIAILAIRDRLRSKVPFSSLDQVSRVSDKAEVTKVAPSVGISVPAQLELINPADRKTRLGDALAFPVVVKPARSVVHSGGKLLRCGVSHVADRDALDRVLDQIHPDAYPVLLQQRVVGPGVGVFLLIWDGEMYGVFSHRRLREKPPSGGVSVYRESIPADAALVARSRKLLDQFGWHGVAMVEYKVQESDGTPYLMEINGRFWGSLQLAVDAGVDFPRLLVELALGRPVTPVLAYRAGVRSRWWWGDVDHLLARMRKSDRRLALPPGSPGRFRTLAGFFLPWRAGDRNEVFRLDDPQPFLRETIEWFRRR